LLAVWKQTGRKPKELEEHGDCPENLLYLWRWFLEIKPPLTYTEVHHWQELTGKRLFVWEVKLLMNINRLIQ
jgi:hypothetical protein